MQFEYTIPVSFDQLEAIEDHLFQGEELGMVSDERVWMLKQLHKKYPGAKILAADLNQIDGTWLLKVDT
jgi:hypothetical protein